jgi:hypothetical protein
VRCRLNASTESEDAGKHFEAHTNEPCRRSATGRRNEGRWLVQISCESQNSSTYDVSVATACASVLQQHVPRAILLALGWFPNLDSKTYAQTTRRGGSDGAVRIVPLLTSPVK